MQVVETVEALRLLLGKRPGTAIVPTMGNLHDGHLELVRAARKVAPITVVTIFVNRLQFGPREDFDRYPRTIAADCGLLARESVDYVFTPDESELYPEPQRMFVTPDSAIGDVLEGAFRPGFFNGVATVVMKLFNIVQPQFAVFGKKDYQQFRVIERMIRDLNLPIGLVGVNTVRTEDGLALSSRNSYLSAPELAEAPRLHRTLHAIAAALILGERSLADLENSAMATLREAGWQPDYVAIRRQSDLQPPAPQDRDLVVLAAAKLGRTRLIDNVELTRR